MAERESRLGEDGVVDLATSTPLALIPEQSEIEGVDISSLSPLELLKYAIENGVEIVREETINPKRLNLEDSVVDAVHVRELRNSIEQLGQLQRILVRAREEEPGQVVYDIADGFHRGASASGSIDAKVLYNWSDAKLHDVRIVSSTVKSVEFTRIAQWMEDSFSDTPWAAKGLSVSQAFSILLNDSGRTRGIRLSPQEIEGVKEWCSRKCELWGDKTPAAVYQVLRLTADADPALVKEVRSTPGGRERKPGVTADRLKAVVSAFPGPDNFDKQNLLMEEIRNRQFTSAETGLFIRVFKKKYRAYMDETDIRWLMSTIDIERLFDRIEKGDSTTNRPSVKLNLEAAPRPQSKDDLGTSSENTSGSQELPKSRSLAIDRSLYPRQVINSGWSQRQPENTSKPQDKAETDEDSLTPTLDIAEKKIGHLQSRVEELQSQVDALTQTLNDTTWWRNEPGLSALSKSSLELILSNRISVAGIAKKMHVEPKDVIRAIIEGLDTNYRRP